MNYKKLITTAALTLLPLTAGAATLIVPAAGSAPGANGSVWKSELTMHNTSARAIVVTLTYHVSSGALGTVSRTIPARSTVSLDDVVRSQFTNESSIGAIEINVADADANRLAVASRTSNVMISAGSTFEFGQDIPAIAVADAAKSGDVAVIAGPRSAFDFRFNAGVYAVTASTIRWELIRENGDVASSKTVSYAGGVQNQYSVPALFGAAMANNDVVHATVVSGTAIFYGSIINQASGDPSFVPGVRTREQARITLVGIDDDENGTIDIAAHDNTLDRAVEAGTIGFPAFFRIVSESENGGKVTYEIISSTAEARFIDTNGTVQLVGTQALQGTTGEIKVRATNADGQSVILTIPVKFV